MKRNLKRQPGVIIKYLLLPILLCSFATPLMTFAQFVQGEGDGDGSGSSARDAVNQSLKDESVGINTGSTNINDGKFVSLSGGIPGLGNAGSEDASLVDYLNALFRFAIGIGALAAVLRITFAGIKYMTSEVSVSSKEDAKDDIQNSILGLLLLLSVVIILQQINPNLLNLNFLDRTGRTTIEVNVAPTVNSGTGVRQVAINTAAGSNRVQVAAFRKNCEDNLGGRSVANNATGVIECRGVQNVDNVFNFLETFEDEFKELKEENENLYNIQRARYIDSVMNNEPKDPEGIIAALPKDYAEGEVVFVVKRPQQTPGQSTVVTNDLLNDQKNICENQFGGYLVGANSDEAIIRDGQQHMVCVR